MLEWKTLIRLERNPVQLYCSIHPGSVFYLRVSLSHYSERAPDRLVGRLFCRNRDDHSPKVNTHKCRALLWKKNREGLNKLDEIDCFFLLFYKERNAYC